MRIDQTERNGETYIIKKPRGKDPELITDFDPYFFVREEEVDKFRGVPSVKSVSTGHEGPLKEDLTKIVCYSTNDVNNLKSKVGGEHWEADIQFEWRYFADEVKENFESDDPAIIYLDIENASSGSKIDARGAPDPIVMITGFYHNRRTGEEELRTFAFHPGKASGEWYNGKLRLHDLEEELLKDFTLWLRQKKPDIITGWNVNSYDIVNICSRMEKNELNPDKLSSVDETYLREWRDSGKYYATIKGIDIVDLDGLYKDYVPNDRKSWTLKYICEYEGIDMEHQHIDSSQLRDVWLNDFEQLYKYNALDDVRALVELDRKENLIEFYEQKHVEAAMPLNDTIYHGKVATTYIMRRVPYKIPSRSNQIGAGSEWADFKGGKTLEAPTGIEENLICIDVASQYPSAIVSCNMGPRTLSDDGAIKIGEAEPGEIRFKAHSEQKSSLVEPVEELFEDKKKLTKEREKYDYGTPQYRQINNKRRVKKEHLNSFQGIMGHKGGAMYLPKLGAAITMVGRKVVLHIKETLEKHGYEVVYGDTDSVFCKSKNNELMEQISEGEELVGTINESFDELAEKMNIESDKHIFAVNLESVIQRAFFKGKKKHYAYRTKWIDGRKVEKNVIKGFGAVRSDEMEIVSKAQDKILNLALNGEPRKTIIAGGKKLYNKVRSGDIDPMDVAEAKRMNKDINQYGGVNKNGHRIGKPHFVRAAEHSNELLDKNYTGGDKFYVVWIDDKRKYIAVDHESEIPDKFSIDTDKALERLERGLNSILNSLGIKWHEMTPQTELQEFGQ